MMLFNVRCEVLEPIHLTDSSGNDVTINPGSYRLQGIEHLINSAGGQSIARGTDLSFVDESDGKLAYTVRAENLAHFISLDEIEVKP